MDDQQNCRYQSSHPVPSASNGAARRHRIQGGRPRHVKIRFTDAEYNAIAARATEARVSIPRLLVDSALLRRHRNAVISSALTAELAALRRLVANLANNINQIARKLNSGGAPDASIPAAAEAVQRALRRLDAALAYLNTNPADSAPPPAIPDPDRPPTGPGIPGTPRTTSPPHRNIHGAPG
ncbi:MAG: plasmid mobilization relaxosome protein MobC [Streptosporangiaceae bacterium]|nr:plasmid mobilization relaxosome protein MobC [Streptosporangiaceae bacterium]